ncbi:helix-turn-helix domain-containing protein [Pedobacter sp. UBA4863]|uniref:helix-turn-helix domain-containing protein n=1 Tax=Pedobacter sp. UBA4863 TaxID=1947060 RepID=UPI0025CDC02F|nr:AraC family transcriptional regulator [Pedobacter sp. UBA4863]
MKLYIKNMVCDRCKMAVATAFEKLDLHPLSVVLGEVELPGENLSEEKHHALKNTLENLGFELLEDKKKTLVAQIKAAIIELAHYTKEPLKVNLSIFLSNKLGIDYASLSGVFSAEENNTIERYYIQQKIEKAKELLSYGELTLSEIAFQLNYSSVAHLSAQFKKETGLTPSQFKQDLKRKTLDSM